MLMKCLKYLIYIMAILVIAFEPFFFKFLTLLIGWAAWTGYAILEREWLYLMAQIRTIVQKMDAAAAERDSQKEVIGSLIELLKKQSTKKGKKDDQ